MERVNNHGNYEKKNCAWKTDTDQARNKRNNVILELNGERLCIAAWAEKTGISVKNMYARKKRGWNDERIITTP